MKNKVIAILEGLWTNYHTSDEKSTKPPTLDRITRLYQKENGGEFLPVRKQIKDVLADGDFVKTKEKDNCGISWNCYCWTNSQYLQECLNSKNRAS